MDTPASSCEDRAGVPPAPFSQANPVAPDQTADIFAAAKTLRINTSPAPIDFAYPDTGNMAELVRKVLEGAEYPILGLPGYNPRLIVDIGANVGAAAIYLAQHYPSAEVHCYEPSRENLAFLTRNITSFPRLHAHPFGLHDRDQEIDLFFGASTSMQCSVIPSQETGSRTERIALKRARPELERIGLGAGGCVLKLDTEGCEVPILRDLGDRLDAVDLLYLEYHAELDRRALDGMMAAHDLTLAWMRADHPHRGTALYVARRLMTAFPILDTLRLDRPPS